MTDTHVPCCCRSGRTLSPSEMTTPAKSSSGIRTSPKGFGADLINVKVVGLRAACVTLISTKFFGTNSGRGMKPKEKTAAGSSRSG